MSSRRGTKRNDNLPPNRARDVQRAFRARRAAHLQVRCYMMFYQVPFCDGMPQTWPKGHQGKPVFRKTGLVEKGAGRHFSIGHVEVAALVRVTLGSFFAVLLPVVITFPLDLLPPFRRRLARFACAFNRADSYRLHCFKFSLAYHGFLFSSSIRTSRLSGRRVHRLSLNSADAWWTFNWRALLNSGFCFL